MNISRSQPATSLWMEYALVLLGGLALLVLFALGNQAQPLPLAFARLVLGLLFTLFIPGYYIVMSVWRDPEALETSDRIALSIGLSCAQLPLIALLLDLTDLGITLDKIAIAEALMIGIFGAIAYLRRTRTDIDREYVRPSLSSQPRRNLSKWALSTMIALTVIATMIALLGLALSPHPANQFTEFYILGQGNGARQYPRALVVGEPTTITVGIHNREAVPQNYTIEVRDGDTLIGQQLPVTLAANEAQELEVTFAPAEAGEMKSIEFLLLRGDGGEVYRRLELLVRVEPVAAMGEN